MGFLGIYKALYDYAPQSEGELAIAEGNLLYLLNKDGDDGWWKVKKKATGDDDDEPEGLVPENYVEEAKPSAYARALYEYTRQTDEELSFPEDARLGIYDTTDPDWILAGYDGEYGFVPANYIDQTASAGEAGHEESASHAEHEAEPEHQPEPEPAAPALPARQQPAAPPVAEEPTPRLPPRNSISAPPPEASSAATALASVLSGRKGPSTPPIASPPARQRYFSDASEEEEVHSPPLPSRPRPPRQTHFEDAPVERSPSTLQRSHTTRDNKHFVDDPEPQHGPIISPGAFHLYNISEMVSVMGKRKKMPTTLGVNLKTGKILIAPERSQDGPSQEWTADRMTHYSREGKHVFLELVRPSKSVDFHAGAKDTAEEIVTALGELAGAVRAGGLREVLLAASGHDMKKGVILYDFVSQGDDEVTVSAGDEVVVMDNSSSEEWCQVRRVKNGKEGVVPSSYVEITGMVSSAGLSPGLGPGSYLTDATATAPSYAPEPSSPTTTTAISASEAKAAARGTVLHNRMEEERMTRAAVRAAVKDESESSRRTSEHRSKNGNRTKSKPDPSKVRTWTDRTKSFSVDAQFIGLKDNKINLHKLNGVKIAVPVAKMSLEDLEYVERATGISLDEDKPLSSMRRSQQLKRESGIKVGATIEPKKPDYDWFQFFLSCDVAVGLCERYTQAFVKDNMDESVLPDIEASVLRTLGLREGDIIKVMRALDAKFGRTKKGANSGEGDGEGGGLFSGPGGTLRNNTRRGRPTPSTQASDVVDAAALKTGDGAATTSTEASGSAGGNNGNASSASAAAKGENGFEDDAWSVKPARQSTPSAAAAAVAPAPAQPATPTAAPAPAPAAAPAPAPAPVVPALTGSLQELSLLTQPLPAEKLNPTPTAATLTNVTLPAMTATATATAPAAQLPGATPGFFSTLGPQPTGAFARARPMVPQFTQSQAGLLPPPPPARPLSAPQSAQPSVFGPPPLQPQMTGIVSGQVAPTGQSLNDIAQARMQQQQQQQQQMMAQPTGMMPMMTGMPQQQPFMPMQTGMSPFGAQPMMMQPTGFQPQPTGFQPQPTGFQPQGGLNTMLPPALEPQRTSMPPTMGMGTMAPMQAQPTGHFTQGFGNYGMAPMTSSMTSASIPAPAPLMPQQTGPAPPVRFGVKDDAKKLAPQPTGRRANLSAATPDNPFGF